MFDFSFDQSNFNFDNGKNGDDQFTFGTDTNLQPIVDHLTGAESSIFPPVSEQAQQQQQQQTELLSPYTLPSNDHSATTVGKSSPSSTDNPGTSVSSFSPAPEAPPRKKAGRKRKSSSGDESKSASGASPEDGPPVKKTSHNVIEKRYRNNLNDKIQELRDSVPSLRAMSRPGGGDESEDLEGLTPAHKLNKATVLAKATEYIKHLEKRNKNAMTEMDALKTRLAALEKSVAKSAAMQNMQSAAGNGIFNNPSMNRSRQGSLASQALGPAGRRTTEQYGQQHAQSTYEPQTDSAEPGQQRYVNAQSTNGGLLGKVMVGSLAGLMVMEGFHEQEQNSQGTSGRGLFAAPGLLRRGDVFSVGEVSSSQTLYPLLKMFLLLGALLYVIVPLFSFKREPKANTPNRIRLTAAPSLASPVEVRRKAWLTAVQSVWMPRHFLLEVVSVATKMLKLSLRRLIGSEAYTIISGNNKEDEAARIKAWDIAIDAQLAGGDAEVSYYRLLLTLMVSGTLPDSPIRLMQKAVHFRIFFWELANAGYGNLFMFRDFTAKVGRFYWDSARAQQHALVAGGYTEQQIIDDKIEMLPDHLAALIELGCDDVLSDEIIQRAYNLAWNRPSAENTLANHTMDSVIEDHAIRSPLDAVAAWFSTMTIDGALSRSLEKDNEAAIDVEYLVDLANKVAPPVSGTQTRALAAKSVLVDADREASIAATLSALPARTPSISLTTDSVTAVPSNMITHTPVSPDIHIALTLAKFLSLASPTSLPAARVHAASALSALHLVPNSLTLLTSVAAFKLLRVFSSDTVLFNAGKSGVDDLAASLRMWIGTRAGKRAGLSREQKSVMVETALSVSKRVGGWREEGEEKDSGYGSLQD
ncbi:hypothetical protein BDV97DRAFT_305703 [Delphinella strobiligena]|nr:hypothetical protein BDV97DRAFT_305703 [Delphinella strobiligena]